MRGLVAAFALPLSFLVLIRRTDAAGVLPVPNLQAEVVKNAYDDFSEHFLLPQDFVLAEQTPVQKPTAAEIDAMQNALLFEGDIVGMPTDAAAVSEAAALARLRDDPIEDEAEIFGKPYHSSLNLATYPDKLWTDGIVPYMLEEGMTNAQRAAIAQAFDEYKEKTCIRFVPRTDDDFDYIYLKRNVAFGCSSYVGRAGGNQTVSLEVGKCFSKGIIAHELMHALGFFHEHSRTDRDEFVNIEEDNIRPGMLRNFEKYPRKIIDPLGMPYDYESVMHYHKLAFSRNGRATIVPKEKDVEIGQRYKLSDIDAKKVNKLYQCGEFSKTKTTTTTTEEPTTTAVTTTTTTEVSTTPTEPTTTMERTTSRRWTKKPLSSSTSTMAGKKTTTSSTSTTSTTKKPSSTTTTKRPKEESSETEEEDRDRKKKCENLNAHCEMWEQLGHCQHSSKYMGHYCRKACGLCSQPEEKSKEKGEKEKSTSTKSGGGKENSKKCADKNLFCGYWAKIGECRSESKFMKIFCMKSCGLCDE